MFNSIDPKYDNSKMFSSFLNKNNSVERYGYQERGLGEITDPSRYYYINKHGFRGKEISGKEDILIAGCSFTFGSGIPEEKIWGVQVANNMSLSYSNLGYPGASILSIINSIFSYFKEYGNPKILACLFPDLDRIQLPVDNKIWTSKSDNLNKDLARVFLGEHHNNLPRYSKAPHNIENVMPLSVPRWISIKYIQILEQYCRSSNIKFIWSTWDNRFLPPLVESKQFDFLINTKNIDQEINNKCHNDLKNDFKEIFDRGSDIEYGLDRAHWGVHKHTHYAEYFEKALK
jgi:hypothetical protein